MEVKTFALIGVCGYIAHGILLPKSGKNGIIIRPKTGWRYQETGPGTVGCLDWDNVL